MLKLQSSYPKSIFFIVYTPSRYNKSLINKLLNASKSLILRHSLTKSLHVLTFSHIRLLHVTFSNNFIIFYHFLCFFFNLKILEGHKRYCIYRLTLMVDLTTSCTNKRSSLFFFFKILFMLQSVTNSVTYDSKFLTSASNSRHISQIAIMSQKMVCKSNMRQAQSSHMVNLVFFYIFFLQFIIIIL